MTTPMRTTFLSGGALLLLTAVLTAQKLPLPDGSGRQLQLFDLQLLHGTTDRAPGLRVAPPKVDPRAAPTALTDQQAIADMLGHFVEPALGPGDACQVLGERWLAVLGSPAQIASAERLFRLAAERRERTIDVQIQLLQIADKDFAGSVRKHLVDIARDGKVSCESVLEDTGAKALEAVLDGLQAQRIEAPKLSVFPLQRAHMSRIDQTAYVRDFTLVRKGDTVIADPIVDVVWDGNVTDVCATFLPDGMLGVTCDVAFQEVQQPIRTFETTIGKNLPVTLQLPRVTGTRLRQTAVLGEGSLVVLATQKVDGDWIVALVRAKAAPR